LAQAKAEIRALVERDFNRKSTRGRKRHARFLEDHTAEPASAPVSAEIMSGDARDPRETQPQPGEDTREPPKLPAEPGPPPEPQPALRDAFADDEVLPVFEADLDLPRLSAAVISTAAMEES